MYFQKPPLGTPLDWGNPLNDETVLALAMNEGHGDKVQDLSLNGNHGTLNNFAHPPTVDSGWNPGQTGVGLTFDGASTYINCGSNPIMSFGTDPFTLAALVRYVPAATTHTIVRRDNEADGNRRLYGLSCNGDNVSFQIYDSANGNKSTPVHDISDGGWHNVVGVRDDDDIILYVDGNLIGSTAGCGAHDMNVTGGFLSIGRYQGVVGGFLEGPIDQPRIQSRTWSAKEVKDYAINPWQVYLDE